MKKTTYSEILFILFCLFLPTLVFAEGGGHGDAHGHAAGLTDEVIQTIIYQAINVVALLVGLVYFVRKGIQTYFANRTKQYHEAAEKAHLALRKAEENHLEIKVRLSKLKESRQESIARAHAEANDLKRAIVEEAHQFSRALKHEAEAAAKREVEKARAEIKAILILEARSMAEAQLKSGITKELHQKLTGNFLSNSEATRP